MDNQQTIIDNIGDLPSPPIVVHKLTQKISDKDASSHEIAKIIETDQAFSARVLRLVNSPFYGFARKVVIVEEAITMLGINTIHQLLLTTSLLRAFKDSSNVININSFWKHSFGVGIIAKNLLYDSSKDTQNEAFLCGVLHDVGRLALIKIDADRFYKFYFENDSAINLENEEEHFGVTHQQIGGMLARKWNFPEVITTVIENHHSISNAPKHKKLLAAVNIADIISHAFRFGESGNYYVSVFYPEAWKTLNVDSDKLEEVLMNSVDEIAGSDEMLREINKDG